MTVDRLTIAFIVALVATGLLSWHTFRQYQAAACIDGGGHWDKRANTCRDRPIYLNRGIYRS